MRRPRAALVTLMTLSLIVGASGTALASNVERHVNMLDDCDAATFDAVLGDGACTKNG